MQQSDDKERTVSLRCWKCNAKLRASIALVGATCPCPRCRQRVVVRLPMPSDANIVLVPAFGTEER